MRTRWLTEERRRKHAHTLQRRSPVLSLRLGRLRYYTALGTQDDGALWGLLLCALRWVGHRCQLADVGRQALEQILKWCDISNPTQTVSFRPTSGSGETP